MFLDDGLDADRFGDANGFTFLNYNDGTSYPMDTWADVAGDELTFTRDLYANYNMTVLPGSLLAHAALGSNPGTGRIRMALVADTAECAAAAHRIRNFVQRRAS